MSKYKGWELLDTIPPGWKIDKTVGSPLCGYEFITNGKSVLNGQRRALVKISNHCAAVPIGYKKNDIKIEKDYRKPQKKKSNEVIHASAARAVNELARKKFEERILKDIMTDLMICEIEGWCKTEYIDELKRLIIELANNNTITQLVQYEYR